MKQMKENEAFALIKESVDYVLESYRGNNYWQFVTSTGGDIDTYRVYDSGTVGMK